MEKGFLFYDTIPVPRPYNKISNVLTLKQHRNEWCSDPGRDRLRCGTRIIAPRLEACCPPQLLFSVRICFWEAVWVVNWLLCLVIVAKCKLLETVGQMPVSTRASKTRFVGRISQNKSAATGGNETKEMSLGIFCSEIETAEVQGDINWLDCPYTTVATAQQQHRHALTSSSDPPLGNIHPSFPHPSLISAF